MLGGKPARRPWASILEFGSGGERIWGGLYNLYLNRALPLVGRIFSKDPAAYEYLAATIRQFPPAAALERECAMRALPAPGTKSSPRALSARTWAKKALTGKARQQQAHGHGSQAHGAQPSFGLGQQLAQGAAHAAGKERPAKPFQHNGQAQGAQKKIKIKPHALVVTEKRGFVKDHNYGDI